MSGKFEAGQVIEAVDEFISCKSPATQRAYHKTLEGFAEFLEVKRDSFAFERALVEFPTMKGMKFLRWIRSRGNEQTGEALADNTVSLRVTILRRVFRLLIDLGVRSGNPFALLNDTIPTRQKVQVRPTKLIPFELVPKILDAPSRYTKDGIRDRAILALLFGGGLRRNEVVKLNIGDIGRTPEGVPYLILRAAKAGTNQEQSLPNWAWSTLEAHLQQRDKEGAKPTDPIFVTGQGRMSDCTVRRLYYKYTEAVGIVGAACHSARATAATMLKEKGFEDRDVARFLRHSTETMVRAYDKRSRGPAKNPGRSLEYDSHDSEIADSLHH